MFRYSRCVLIFPTITNNNVITLKELDEAIEKRINRTYDEILNENQYC